MEMRVLQPNILLIPLGKMEGLQTSMSCFMYRHFTLNSYQVSDTNLTPTHMVTLTYFSVVSGVYVSAS